VRKTGNNILRLKVNFDKLHKQDDFIYPNPVKDIISFYSYGDYSGVINLSVFDMNGKLVGEQTFIKFNANVLFTFKNLELKSGLYVLKVEKGNDSVKYYKFVK